MPPSIDHDPPPRLESIERDFKSESHGGQHDEEINSNQQINHSNRSNRQEINQSSSRSNERNHSNQSINQSDSSSTNSQPVESLQGLSRPTKEQWLQLFAEIEKSSMVTDVQRNNPGITYQTLRTRYVKFKEGDIERATKAIGKGPRGASASGKRYSQTSAHDSADENSDDSSVVLSNAPRRATRFRGSYDEAHYDRLAAQTVEPAWNPSHANQTEPSSISQQPPAKRSRPSVDAEPNLNASKPNRRTDPSTMQLLSANKRQSPLVVEPILNSSQSPQTELINQSSTSQPPPTDKCKSLLHLITEYEKERECQIVDEINAMAKVCTTIRIAGIALEQLKETELVRMRAAAKAARQAVESI